jgi:hypothetical protein
MFHTILTFLSLDTRIELSNADDAFLTKFPRLDLGLIVNDRLVDYASLSSRKSSSKVWDAGQILILYVLCLHMVAESLLSI